MACEKRIHSREELLERYEVVKALFDKRYEVNPDNQNYTVLICAGCHALGSDKIIENFKKSVKEHGLEDKVQVSITGCIGFCNKGPLVKILPDNTFYVSLKEEDPERIVKEHEEILEAFKKKDPAAAKKALDKHLSRKHIQEDEMKKKYPQYFA